MVGGPPLSPGRSSSEHELFSDSLSGAPETGEALVMEGFDSRGVRRTTAPG
jgi:hypothetical protein